MKRNECLTKGLEQPKVRWWHRGFLLTNHKIKDRLFRSNVKLTLNIPWCAKPKVWPTQIVNANHGQTSQSQRNHRYMIGNWISNKRMCNISMALRTKVNQWFLTLKIILSKPIQFCCYQQLTHMCHWWKLQPFVWEFQWYQKKYSNLPRVKCLFLENFWTKVAQTFDLRLSTFWHWLKLPIETYYAFILSSNLRLIRSWTCSRSTLDFWRVR